MNRSVRAAAAMLAVALTAASLTPAGAASSGARATETDVTRATLENGLRVVVVHDPLAPVTTEIVNYLVGAADAPAAYPGMAHALEHMTAGRSNSELTADQMATITTLLGGDFNADTQTSVTQYYVTTPANYLDIALRVEAARMTDVTAPLAEWQDERGAINQEVSSDLGSAFYRYYDKAQAILFAGTPYDHTPLGTRPSFNKLTGPEIHDFWKTWYAPNNAILVISGDVDGPATVAKVREIFGKIPSHPVPAHAPVSLRPLATGDVIRDTSDFSVPLVLLTYRMPGYHDKDYAAVDVLSDVLSSERGSLSALAFDGKALQTGFTYQPYGDAGFAYTYLATTPGGDTSAGLALLTQTIGAIAKNGVPAELVDAAKRREVAQALFSRNSIDGLAQEWSDAVAVQGLASPDQALARIRAVTPADVSRVAREYLVRDRAVVGVLTPKPGSPSSSAGGGVVKDTFTSKGSKPVPLPTWAHELATVPPVPTSLVTPSDVTLPNGLRLIVQTEHVSPTVTVRGIVRQTPPLQTPPGQEGIVGILGQLFGYGTTQYDRLAYQKQLDDIAADANAGASFGLAIPVADLDRGMALLAQNELSPALPASAFSIVKQQTVSELPGELTSPDYLAARALERGLLPVGDPSLRQPTPLSVGRLTLGDVQAHRVATFRPDVTTIVMVGDVTPDRARVLVEKYFGGWTARGPKPQLDLPSVPLNPASSHTINAPGRTQTTVKLTEQIGITRTNPDYYALALGNAILGGAFYSTRYSRDLRQNSGLVYSVSPTLSAGRTRATYGASYGSDPENVAKARALIDRDLHDLATTAPTDAEVAQAQTQLLRDLDLSEASVSSIAGGLLGRAVAGLPLDEPTREGQAFKALTGPQIRDTFAKYVDPKRFVQVNEGP